MKSPKEAAFDIAQWLATHFTPDGFPARTFYGESFSLWLWSCFPDEFSAEIEQIRPFALQQLNRQDIDAHPEFNLFATLKYCQQANIPVTELTDLKPRFRNTANSNWLLLSNLGRVLWNNVSQEETYSQKDLLRHTKLLLRMQQQSDGLIRDDRLRSRKLPIPLPYAKGGKWGKWGIQYLPRLRSLSLQYHCFSLALLQLLQNETAWPISQHIERGIDAIINFTLPNGDTIYFGRGQQQIFGYASLLFVLAAFCQGSTNPIYAQKWHDIWQFFLSFQRDDLSWPLVLREGEKGFPKTVDTTNSHWLGWYGYNNYFDYLPLLGAFLAQCELPANEPMQENNIHTKTINTGTYTIIESNAWKGTITKPAGPISHDQPIPYLCVNGRSILPCFGGEEAPNTPYNLSMLPIPFLQLNNGEQLFLRSVLKWKLTSNSKSPLQLKGNSSWATFTRQFAWADDHINFQDNLIIHPNHKTAPQDIQQVIPFQFSSFLLNKSATNIYEIFQEPKVQLQINHLENEPIIVDGYSPVGKIKIIREQLDWASTTRTEFQRNYSLSWTNQ